MKEHKMNNIKKVTVEAAVEDFEKVMVFNLLNKLKKFFPKKRGGGFDYLKFWNAPDEFAKFRALCQKYGSQPKDVTHYVYDNIEKFDRCSLSGDAVRAIFRGIPHYQKLIEKFLVAPHGTLLTKKSVVRYGNVYRPESIKVLEDIVRHGRFNELTDLHGNYYTKRQKHIIVKYVIGKQEETAIETAVKTQRPEPTPAPQVEDPETDFIDELDELDESLDFNDELDKLFEERKAQ